MPRRFLILLFLSVAFFYSHLYAQKETKSNEKRLVVIAKLIEIRGKYPPNDLYDYVYIFKYQVLKVISGKYDDKTIFVGHYNPRIPRDKIKDKMAKVVSGSVTGFRAGDEHKLELVLPMEKYWNNAVIDEYFDDDAEHECYFALKSYIIK
jgi:hypothetical protein